MTCALAYYVVGLVAALWFESSNNEDNPEHTGPSHREKFFIILVLAAVWPLWPSILWKR